MAKWDEGRLFEMLQNSSTASASILAGLAIGIFTVLTLFTMVNYLSIAWIVLSIAYLLISVAGILMFRGWVVSQMMAVYFFKEYTPEANAMMSDITGGKRIRKFFFNDPFLGKDWFYLGTLIIFIIMATAMWFVFAFNNIDWVWQSLVSASSNLK